MAYKVIDLFAGAGGLSLGFMQTGRFEIVAAAENNPGARKTYKRNHKLARLYPDVRTIDYTELEESCGEIDVVIGGPPCQGFSNANRQHTTIISMNNRLVKEYVRAVRELEPKAFVMENVAMLKSNIHRFMVEEADINDPTIMKLPLTEDKIELLPKNIYFPNAVSFAKDISNIKTYLWDEKELKAITVLYRFRINKPKFASSVSRYRKYLTELLADIAASNDEDWVRTQERKMAQIRYLGLKNDEIGFSGSEGGKTTIKAPIIYPQEATGLRNGVRVVSFMMSAEKLLRTSYVLRKDSWEESMFLYQRLIEKDKVKSIRAFLAQKGEAFYNNIIVALPDNVTFEDDAGTPILVENIGDFQHCKLVLPDEMNSICIIDGQHRIFAHYEAPATEKYELQIAPLRRQLHLLVTGLIFPTEMKEPERKQIQSPIFLDINDNTKKVAPNVLTHIEMVKDPFSDIGLARRVIERLNKKRVFLNRFELSALDESKIKVASIIKFALRYLVTVTPAEGKTSLYAYWQGNKEAFQQKDEASLNDYIEFCANSIDLYFSAIRDAFKSSWNDPASKMLSVISINGFIIAFNRQLNKYGVSDYPFYSSCLRKLSIDFSKNGFPYTSSQYRKFSGRILAEAFDFTNEELETT